VEKGGREEFAVTMCGSTAQGQSVGLTITTHNPYLYVKIPDTITGWSQVHTERFQDYVKRSLWTRDGDLAKCLVSIKPMQSKVLYPFTNNKLHSFLKITVSCLKAFRKLSWAFKRPIKKGSCIDGVWEPYESNIDPLVRFTHIANITTAGWITVSDVTPNKQYTRLQINISTSKISNISQMEESLGIAPFVMASFDIEVDSQATRKRNIGRYDPNAPMEERKNLPTIFPDAGKGDTIRIICTSYQRFGSQEYFKHCVALAPCDHVDGADHLDVVDTEKELLTCWIDLIVNTDPDVIMGYNIYGFDDEYIFQRLKVHNLTGNFERLSRLKYQPCEMKDSKLVTSAYGTNFFKIMDIPCMYKIDLYVWFKKETKLESYKLDRVAEEFLGDRKVDMPPIDLFHKMNSTGADMAECCKYCIQDTMLPLRLTEKRKIFLNLIGMANITRVPIEWLITRGQQVKVFSQLTYETRLNDVLVPSWDGDETASDDKFMGATVLHAEKGAYFEAVSGLDFASLYPSIMIAYNLCYSTMIMPEDLQNYRDDPDVTIETIAWEQDGEEQEYHYVQNIPGIVPVILDKLWKQRKSVKKKMKKAAEDGDEILEGIYNAEQLAIKVSMNSVYGFTGATKGYLPKKPIASSVTAKGRELIRQTKEFCEKNYDCTVVYGDTDSCYVKFKMDTEDPRYMHKIFDLSQKAADECTKLFKKPIELEFEQVMRPFFLFTKKRYAYVQWTNPDKCDKLSAKGIHLVRRDNCEFVRKVSKQVLNKMFFDLDTEGAKDLALTAIGDILENRCKLKELQISKTLKVGYKCSRCHVVETECKCREGPRVNLPHVQLAKRMAANSSADIPQPGERVPFVFVEGVGLQHQRVEHPEYMSDKRPDGLYYLEHQLKVPMETLFELVLPEGDTRVLFENGPYGNLIKSLKEQQKIRETIWKQNVRHTSAQTFTVGQRIMKRVGRQEPRKGVVISVDGDRLQIRFDDATNKLSKIFPDSIHIE